MRGKPSLGPKEAQARVKINKLLEEAGWRLLDSEQGTANVTLELHTKITTLDINELGEDFEKVEKGFVDFLLLDDKSFPLAVLEAKSEGKDPLTAKEQARKYARELNCRYVILSNGNQHYLWDLDFGNPEIISRFPSQDSLSTRTEFKPDSKKLADEKVSENYIVLTQMPDYANNAGYVNEDERSEFIKKNDLRFLREYQLRAVQALQQASVNGSTRYLFEMATGTGKTLTSAAVIRLFLRTGNARRVLFLVDRLELEDQAKKEFTKILKNDYTTVIYKENRQDWIKAEIVVSTVQSLQFDNRFNTFSPTDFDLVISDEAHRSIGGNARAVFEYFHGYKLGLTATPKDYLKNVSAEGHNPRDIERRQLLDTYRTFGCESGEPTFRYSLLDGVNAGFLVNPFVVDARTEITTQLLSDEGYAAVVEGDEMVTFDDKDYEKKIFSEPTNRSFCKLFMEQALRDPINGEIGKSLVFAVSQKHAAKLVQVLNEFAHQMFPGVYSSDFAVQVTSMIPDAKQMTINFANNNLLGTSQVDADYRTSKARVCVTVGMMTTGYDCPDILNLALMRPIFSPAEFVQIKGRGTRKHTFLKDLRDESRHDEVAAPEKETFKLFDFFAVCEYFEDEFDYDQVLELPKPKASGGDDGEVPPVDPPIGPQPGTHTNFNPDEIVTVEESAIGPQGMKVDRRLYERFEEVVRADAVIQDYVSDGNFAQAEEYVKQMIFEKPEEFFNLQKLKKALGLDRRLTIREVIEKAFGKIDRFKTKPELIEDEFEKFVLSAQLHYTDPHTLAAVKYFFKAYLSDAEVRQIVDAKELGHLHTNATLTMEEYNAVPPKERERVIEYIKDYVPLNRFMQ